MSGKSPPRHIHEPLSVIRKKIKTRMKNAITYFAIIFSLNCCAQISSNSFPEVIKTEKTERHQRIKGTKLYAIIPDEFKSTDKNGHFIKDESLSIDFAESTAPFEFNWESLKNDSLGKSERFKINSFEGVFMIDEEYDYNESMFVLFFGDNDFTVIVIGRGENDNPNNKEKIVEIMKSIYYEKELSLEETLFSNFNFDKSICGFTKTFTATDLIVFTENGEDLSKNPSANFIVLRPLQQTSKNNLKNEFKFIIRRDTEDRFNLENDDIIETKIGNYEALVFESKSNYQKKIGRYLQILLTDNDKSIVFTGSTFHNVDEWIKKYKKTVESIVIK